MKRIKSERIILSDGIFDGYIYFENGEIKAVTKEELPYSEEIDCSGLYVSAGFIDLHTHGGGGFSFSGSVEDIAEGCRFHLKHGTTSLCPTVSADDFSLMANSTERIALAMKLPETFGTIIGAHLEGPYLSEKQAGAQCPSFITPPKSEDYLPLLQKHGESIARWTYAPENDREQAFTRALRQYGVLPSAGHTDGIYEELTAAHSEGCNLITHLYSCTSTITRDHGFRRLGVIETAYLLDDMFVEIICDGKHLPPELIRFVYRFKGADKTALITDSLSLAGTSETHGFMQNTEYIIEDGVCKLMDRSAFAGSIATADRLVRVAVKEAGIPLVDAVRMITETPAKIMKLQNKGSVSVGMDADLVVFDDDIQILRVFKNGNEV